MVLRYAVTLQVCTYLYMAHIQTFHIISFGLVNKVASDIFLYQEMYNIYESEINV